MTPAQCRAARALIGMSQPQLAFASVVSLGAIIDFEAEATTPKDEDLDAIQDALERAGVEFIEDGVKLRKGGK
jgi:transcriptional regulator with XRE-family HTH domain